MCPTTSVMLVCLLVSKILHHAIIIVLHCAVVCIEVYIHLTEAMVLQKVVHAAHYSFSAVTSLICQRS